MSGPRLPCAREIRLTSPPLPYVDTRRGLEYLAAHNAPAQTGGQLSPLLSKAAQLCEER